MDILFLTFCALLAGFFDAVVGGGGLIQLPALFAALPNQGPAYLLGTNKIASIFGTFSAALRFSKLSLNINWPALIAAGLCALLASGLGAYIATLIEPQLFKPLLLVVLLVMVAHVLRTPNLGVHNTAQAYQRTAVMWLLAISAVMGFYDGLLGPGTGSIIIFLLVRFVGYDFIHASAQAKVINFSTNLGAILYFAPNGYMLLPIALLMALANILGALIGVRMAIRYGSRFIRKLFLLVSGSLMVKIAYDTLVPYLAVA